MGILNVTPDSFSDGGRSATVDGAVARALRMIEDGAAIIDIGGESTRPGAETVALEEELRRVIPVVTALRARTDALISVDTYKARVAEAALDAGADMINDISAGRFDSAMTPLIADRECAFIMMHMQGTPRDMQRAPAYADVVTDVRDFFVERLAASDADGIDRARLVIDPGIGFGKTLAHNLALLCHVGDLTALGAPVLIGASRKSFISNIYDRDSAPDQRLGGSLAAALMAVNGGARIIRAHDVRETVEALAVWRALDGEGSHGTL